MTDYTPEQKRAMIHTIEGKIGTGPTLPGYGRGQVVTISPEQLAKVQAELGEALETKRVLEEQARVAGLIHDAGIKPKNRKQRRLAQALARRK